MAKTRTSGVKHIVVSMTNLTDGRKRIVTRIVKITRVITTIG